jgi:ABC-type dipeptide/oligopeptide/nickel transport system permease subunit
MTANIVKAEPRDSLGKRALRKLAKDKLGLVALAVVLVYLIIALGVRFLDWGQGWDELVKDGWTEVSREHWFGTNRNGQDIYKRTIYSTKTAFEVGILVAIFSTLLGGLLGCIAGFFSGTWIDEAIIWFYGCLDSIPFFLFVAAVAFALKANPWAMHVAMIATFWTTTARLIRGEVIKIKYFEYVEAARALGVPKARILFRHILPNTTHILLVQSTIVFVTAIKNEVILSFLGLGVKDGVSWGLMIAEAATEAGAGEFNNLIASSVFMFVLVMAFNLFSDSLQDALDPRKVAA